ncbi:MAG: penicillin-binding transpeptidase domain-containing protein [Thermoanaerobacteraceae bacterium]|nr:penicillin-binding transpeptidase domain-containing protein [Thermoanaerobacteraceae bacterium]
MKKNIRNVLIAVVLMFSSLIGYLLYFEFFMRDTLLASDYNRRLWEEENRVVRGSIIDRNGTVLAETVVDGDQKKRVYYGDASVGPLVGYNSRQYGRSGIEAAYNKELLGMETKNPFILFRQNILGIKDRGYDVILTIDSGLQKTAYEALGGRRGAVVALNPRTGEILAMASSPGFNPNNIERDWEKIKADKESPLINRAIQGLYPPGSVFKIIPLSAALENIEGLDERTFNCTGATDVDGLIIKDYNGTAHGEIDIERAVELSCNSTFINLGLEIGAQGMGAYADSFGFNRNLDFDLPVKMSLFPNPTSKRELALSSIGQADILATPLQMAMVASAVANDGTIMHPYIVKGIADSEGRIRYSRQDEAYLSPISGATADKIKEMMIGVVNRGTGTAARISGIDVAGKTGTAEVQGKKSHAWFIGFAPADDPKIVVAVIVENGGSGGQVAAPIARQVLNKYLPRLFRD